jgi:hypothetical protein
MPQLTLDIESATENFILFLLLTKMLQLMTNVCSAPQNKLLTEMFSKILNGFLVNSWVLLRLSCPNLFDPNP